MSLESQDSPSDPDKLDFDRLSKELQRRIGETLASPVIPLVLDGKPAGTGVLVEVDGVSGILTAEHVIFNPNKSFEKGQLLSTVPRLYWIDSIDEPTTQFTATHIRIDLLRWYPRAAHRKDYSEEGAEWGPDLGFIRLPKGTNFEGNLRAVRINFYSWARKPEARMEKALKQEDTILAVVGGPQEWIEDDPAPRPGQVGKRTKFGILATAQEKYWPEQNGYDFIDALAERGPGTFIPQSFKGVSGGALWRFRDPFHADPQPAICAGIVRTCH